MSKLILLLILLMGAIASIFGMEEKGGPAKEDMMEFDEMCAPKSYKRKHDDQRRGTRRAPDLFSTDNFEQSQRDDIPPQQFTSQSTGLTRELIYSLLESKPKKKKKARLNDA